MNRLVKKYGFVFLIALFHTGCSPVMEKKFSGQTMGTTYAIKIIVTPSFLGNHPALHDSIHFILDQINQQMSTYLETSEITSFNSASANKWIPVSCDLAQVVKTAKRISEKSNGAFDITVSPLVNVWGFGSQSIRRNVPEQSIIDSAMALTGHRKCDVRMEPPALKKNIAGLSIDLSAIAKGYGVDKVAEYLEQSGVKNYLVEIGGEIRAQGHNAGHVPWRIGIQAPDGGNHVQKILSIDNFSVATSGDYRNYFESGGVRYSHTIDPRDGRPIRHTLASVTVLHDTCMIADAYATAINVLGPHQGYQLAVQNNLSVLLLIKSQHGFFEKTTPLFEQFLEKNTKNG